MRPAYWTRRPLKAIGAARNRGNRVSSAGPVGCTCRTGSGAGASSDRTPRVPVGAGVRVCRIGPSCRAMRSSSWSLRYGVAVRTNKPRGWDDPAAGRDLQDGVLECGRGNVVALVDDDQPVAGGKLGDVVGAGEGGDFDDAGSSATSAAA